MGSGGEKITTEGKIDFAGLQLRDQMLTLCKNPPHRFGQGLSQDFLGIFGVCAAFGLVLIFVLHAAAR